MTRTEYHLWQALRGKRLGNVRFRRQHVIGPYVTDFFCSSARLAIEIDGGVHSDEEARDRDAVRDRWMAVQGVRVLRIPARLVEDNIEAALQIVLAAVEKR